MKILDTQTLSSLRSNRTVLGLGAILLLSLVLLIANFLYLNTQSSRDTEYIGHAGELRVLSQQISKSATEAATGTPEAFGLLLSARNDFQQRWDYLVKGDAASGLPPMPTSMAGQQAQLQADWDKVRRNADAILASQGTVLSLHEVAATLSDTVPQLQVEYEDVVDVLIASNAPADQVAIAQRQSLLAERILGSVNRVLEGDEDAVMAADSFGRDASLFGRVLQGMIEGNASIGITRVADARRSASAITISSIRLSLVGLQVG
jgi:twitching motility protein PilJ